MSFLRKSDGSLPTGSESAANLQTFEAIPDGTTARAAIMAFMPICYNEYWYYEVTYKIVDGEFVNRQVRQKLHIYETDAKKRDRAVEQFMRLFLLTNFKWDKEEAPSDRDLAPIIGKIIGIDIGCITAENGKDYNFIRGTHASKDINPQTGVSNSVSVAPQQSRSVMNSEPHPLDDVPF